MTVRSLLLESAPYTLECIDCRSPIEITVVEVLANGTHQWDVEGNCPECGCHWNECGNPAPLPAGMRAAILTANGTASLHVAAGSATPATVMRALRKARELSLIDARATAEKLCSSGLEGTRVEMETLAIPLRTAGAIISIRSRDTA